MDVQTAYLAMVVVAFVAFGVTLFGVAAWQNRQE